VPSFAPAGKDVRDEQDFQALLKFVPFEISTGPKFDKLEQLNHASLTFVASAKSVLNEVREPQFLHALFTAVADGKLATLNVVKLAQLNHEDPKFVTDEKSIFLNSVKSDRYCQASDISDSVVASAAPLSIKSLLADSISAPVADSGNSIMPYKSPALRCAAAPR
jgi:hypothetical protein